MPDPGKKMQYLMPIMNGVSGLPDYLKRTYNGIISEKSKEC